MIKEVTKKGFIVSIAIGLCLASHVSSQIKPVDPKVPHPYWAKVYAQGPKYNLTLPTCITFDHKGRLWVSSFLGSIYRLEDKNQDGHADYPPYIFWTNTSLLPSLEGLLFVGSDLWITSKNNLGKGQIGVFKDTNRDGEPDKAFLAVFNDIPCGLHQANQMALGSDGWIYVGVGSLLDTNPGYGSLAAIWRFNPAAANPKSTMQVFAKGIRNCYDICFDDKGNLFGGDNCRDDGNLTTPPEELNHIMKGGFYGFPTEGSKTITPMLPLPPHCSPVGLVFYTHDRFPGFAGSLILALYRPNGPFLGPPIGGPQDPKFTRKIIRVELKPKGKTFTATAHNWITDFGLGDPPLDMALNKDGELYAISHTISIPEARLYKFSYPYLKLEGSTKIGNKATIRTWAKTGWGVFVILGFPSSAPIPTKFGNFFLNAARPFSVIASGTAPGNDQFVTSISIPNTPALVGGVLAFQSLVGPLTSMDKMILTNFKKLAITK